MNEILQNVHSPGWWFTVVICTLILNVIGSYLKEYLDRRKSDTSAWVSRRSQAKQAKFNALLLKLFANPMEQQRIQFLEQRLRFRALEAVGFNVVCVALFVLYGLRYTPTNVIFYIAAGVTLLSGLLH